MEVRARKGKSLDYRAVAKLIEKQRKPKWVEVTVVGKVLHTQDRLGFKAAVTGQVFLLGEDLKWKKKEKSPFEKLQEMIKAGGKVEQVTGRVEEAKVKKGKKRPPATIRVTGFLLVP